MLMDVSHNSASRNQEDNRLGLNEPISRRDFLNGALLAGAGLLLHGKAPTISPADAFNGYRSEEHTSELQSHSDLVCRLLLEKKKKKKKKKIYQKIKK